MSWQAAMLRMYPSDRPRDEMLGVLEENGRAWYREAPPLLFGALRARTGAGQPASLRWLYAARAAALMLLVASATAPVLDLRYGVQLVTNLMIATWVCAGLAAAAVVLGVRLAALCLATACLVLSGTDQTSIPAIAGYALAAGLALSAGLIAVTGEVADVNDTRGLLILAAWRLGVPAAVVAVAAALTHRRAKV
jgi:hypothetical protein